jgi:hypothetical protein
MQAHFGTKYTHEKEMAEKYQQMWKEAIQWEKEQDIIHAHWQDENVFSYPNSEYGFLNHSGKDSDLAWKRLFMFFRRHLKSI